RQLDRHQEAVREAAPVEGVVEDREIDAGGLVQPPEPVPDGLHRMLVVPRDPQPRAGPRPRAVSGVGDDYLLYFACMSCANLVGLMPHFFSSCSMKPLLCQSATVLDTKSANAFSPCLTAMPHGCTR